MIPLPLCPSSNRNRRMESNLLVVCLETRKLWLVLQTPVTNNNTGHPSLIHGPRADLAQSGAVQIELSDRDHLNVFELLLQLRQKLFGVTHHDDAGAFSIQAPS